MGSSHPAGMASSSELPPPPLYTRWYVSVGQKSSRKATYILLFFAAHERGTDRVQSDVER